MLSSGVAVARWPIAFAVTGLAVAIFGTSAVAAELPGIMVLNIKPEEDASPGLAQILTELVLQNLHNTKRFGCGSFRRVREACDIKELSLQKI